MNRHHRRNFLRGIGGLALAIPPLVGGGKAARAADIPKRLILMFTENGTIPSAFDPAVGPDGITFGEILAPLETFKDQIVVVRGLDNQAGMLSGNGGGGHGAGIGCLWTGTELSAEGVVDNGDFVGWGGGVSVDRHVAKELGGETTYDSLELGVQVSVPNEVIEPGRHMSYDGDALPLTPEDNPQAVFDRLFASATMDPAELERLRAERGTVLDAVVADLEALNAKLGAEDRIKLDAHLTAVREIEGRLGSTVPIGGACQVPVLDAPSGYLDNDSFPAVGRAQMDLLAMALACDLTRVSSLMWSTAGSRTVPSWLGIQRQHHFLSHDDVLYEPELIAVNRWYAEQLAYLLGLLRDMKEVDGSSVLDHTLLVWASPISLGSHSKQNLPIVVAGGCGGAIATQSGGRFLDYGGGRKHNDLLVTICRAMGLSNETFGNPVHCTGPLDELLN
jgi:hypothetical protein